MSGLAAFLRSHALTLVLALIAVVFLATGRVRWRSAWRAIDVDLLLVLFALLVAVEILRESGWLDLAVAKTVARFTHTRPFALALIGLSGVLASLVTNDVTLFIVIPFTVAASRVSDFDLEDAVILEILATNLIGCLTPLGNPQNLFVFHASHWTAGAFVQAMLPFVGMSVAGLLAAVFLLGPSRPLVKTTVKLPELDAWAGAAGVACFALVLLEIARLTTAWPAALAALVAALIFLRHRALAIDFSIVPLFFFAFIDVEGLRMLHVYQFMPRSLYWSAVGLSQVISNVPATVLLAPLARGNWRVLLYGVSAGGCGTIIASLANLLGWRIYQRESGREPRFFWRLTALNFAFLAWTGIGAWLLLR
jgi:Na+/H+ antiporter NhaD/arsenite permease-like protein